METGSTNHYNNLINPENRPIVLKEQKPEYQNILSKKMVDAAMARQDNLMPQNPSPSANQAQNDHYSHFPNKQPQTGATSQAEPRLNNPSPEYMAMPVPNELTQHQDNPQSQPEQRVPVESDYNVHIVERIPQDKDQQPVPSANAAPGKRTAPIGPHTRADYGSIPSEPNHGVLIGKKKNEEENRKDPNASQNSSKWVRDKKAKEQQDPMPAAPEPVSSAHPKSHDTQAKHHIVKKLWSDFKNEMDHRLEKLSPKEDIDELAKRVKDLLHAFASKIDALISHSKSSGNYKAPHVENEDDDGENDSYHP